MSDDVLKAEIASETESAVEEVIPAKKKRSKVPRHAMPEQTPQNRVRNFNSVVLGYSIEMAIAEAERCIQCKKPKCIELCPAEVKIPQFIQAIADGDFLKANEILKEDNALPAVCGRVCPQELQCEQVCILAVKGEAVAIGRLEQFAAEYALTRKEEVLANVKPVTATKEKVAIIGSGPAGITAAGDLVKLGYDVTVFESLHKPGGVLVYGIPAFRLPKAIVEAEVEYIAILGAKIECNVVVGKTITVDRLKEKGFKAFFIGTGAGLPTFMRVPGENANGVYSANEYLTRVILMRAYDFPEYETPVFAGRRVCVVGAGNTAMDASRVSLRLPGVENVYIVYRRSREEAPARVEEIHHAEEEGVIFNFLTQPIEVIHDANNWVTGLKCLRCELGEPDASGRRRPVPIEGSEFVIECDTVVVAVGQRPNPVLMRSIEGLDVSKWGTVNVDDRWMTTNIEGIFAGGDVAVGASTVIMAVGHGKKAARAIDTYLTCKREGRQFPPPDATESEPDRPVDT
jgi:glutamate synthase (NADPH/NADH) small chain